MSRINELDPLLQSLQTLKPPGASKSKIGAITELCLDNPQADATIAQKLYSNFKKTYPTHKLGILFVVDSVTRQWIERAKAAGQTLSPSAPSGTFASGVQRMTELLPSLIDDCIRLAPPDQRAKIQNLVDIWDRSGTFPPTMLSGFRHKLSNPTTNVPSITPPGSPPAGMLQVLGLRQTGLQQQALSLAPPQMPQAQPPQPNDPATLLQALAGLTRPGQPSPAPPPIHTPVAPPPPVASASPDFAAMLAGFAQAGALPPSQSQFQIPQPFQQPIQQPSFTPNPVSVPSIPLQFANFFPQAAAPAPNPVPVAPPPVAANPLASLLALLPPSMLNDPQQLTQVLQLFGELTKANIPQDQWGPVLAALIPQGAPAPVAPVAPAAAQPPAAWQPPNVNTASRDRDRSRSPSYRRDRNGQDRRGSPARGANGHNGQNGQNTNGRNGGGDPYRSRSPLRSRDQPSSNGATNNGDKWLSFDPSLPPNHIRVLSRTLFIGGCTVPDQELRSIFARFGKVQTCITNGDKRHAFVKMCTRKGSVAAKQGMEELIVKDPSILAKARQTKWGVGFGPRDCCDYTVGESIIPIDSLTEADVKWCLSAEYGGTGGKKITPGMVMEEPDIEIGAGVSSKAMSKRVGPEQSGKGKNGKDHHRGGRHNRHRGQAQDGHGRQERRQSPRPPREQSTFQPPPPVPNFGFQFSVPGSGSAPRY